MKLHGQWKLQVGINILKLSRKAMVETTSAFPSHPAIVWNPKYKCRENWAYMTVEQNQIPLAGYDMREEYLWSTRISENITPSMLMSY